MSSPDKNLHFYPTPFVVWHLRLDRWGGVYKLHVKQSGRLLTTAAQMPWQSLLDYTPALGLKKYWETWFERLSWGKLGQLWFRSGLDPYLWLLFERLYFIKQHGRAYLYFTDIWNQSIQNSKWTTSSQSVTQAKLLATKSQGYFCD